MHSYSENIYTYRCKSDWFGKPATLEEESYQADGTAQAWPQSSQKKLQLHTELKMTPHSS